MRTTADRIRHTLGFEIIGLLLLLPLAQWLFGLSMHKVGVLAVAFSLLAMGWNYVYNLWFDRAMLHWRGRLEKTLAERVLHALLFEGGLLVATLPVVAWWFGMSLWDAFVMDMAMALFYLVYAYVYNYGYDCLFPLPAGMEKA